MTHSPELLFVEWKIKINLVTREDNRRTMLNDQVVTTQFHKSLNIPTTSVVSIRHVYATAVFKAHKSLIIKL